MFHVAIFHNLSGRFVPYRHDDALIPAFGFSRALPQNTTAEQLAEWTFSTFNVDPETLVDSDPTIDAASAFRLACRYRLLQMRSLSVGDVVQISAPTAVWWLACDSLGWSAIAQPPNVHAAPDSHTSTTCSGRHRDHVQH